MNEIWKDVVGYEGAYQVSNLGRVRSLDRTVKVTNLGERRLKGRILKQHNYGTNKYLMVVLSKEAKHTNRTVHSLVAASFLGPCPDGCEVLHGLGGKLDNRLRNLKYGTKSENQFDRLRDGTQNNKPVRRGDGKVFSSAYEAGRETGVVPSSISAVCNKYVRPNGKRRLTAGGYYWEFI